MARSPFLLTAALLCTAGAVPGVHARPGAPACTARAPFDEPVAIASARFAIPDAVVRSVIMVESGGAVFAVSPKGAMGLMQLMPGTWADLRRRLGLGNDPFDPCDNILAGTAYLREMLDRYGDPGFLAAYNAGPGRYEEYLSGKRPLPAQTIAYVARMAALTRHGNGPSVAQPEPDPDAWRRGDLFVRRAEFDPKTSSHVREKPAAMAGQSSVAAPVEPVRETLFVPRTGISR